MQSKLGPKSRWALFMGYPEGVKGYHLRDTTSGAFFVARDVIFDEDFGGTEDEEGEDEDEPAHALLSSECGHGASNTYHVHPCPSYGDTTSQPPSQVQSHTEYDQSW